MVELSVCSALDTLTVQEAGANLLVAEPTAEADELRLDNKRRSILAVIPNLNSNVFGKIIYDVNYPLYISVRNDNPIYLRNIRARVLNSDLSPITLKGRAVMTILLK